MTPGFKDDLKAAAFLATILSVGFASFLITGCLRAKSPARPGNLLADTQLIGENARLERTVKTLRAQLRALCEKSDRYQLVNDVCVDLEGK